MASSALCRHSEKFLAGQRPVAKAAEHAAGYKVGVRLVHTSRRHAVMRWLDNDADTLWFQHGVDGVGDLGGQLFLNLEAPGIDVDDARPLADANHAAIWNVGHPGPADDRRHVVLAMAVETDAAQHDHLVIA